jgi:hypothetical protein
VLEASLEHLPAQLRHGVLLGGEFVDVGDRSPEFARLFGLEPVLDGGLLSLRGVRTEGYLAALLALYEPRKIFGSRSVERFGPAVALFDLAFARLWEREAREEAVRTLEDVTQRVHAEYVRRLSALEGELVAARRTPASGTPTTDGASTAQVVAAERLAAQHAETARRAERRAEMLEQQLAAGAGQLEQAQVELHRRAETLRQTHAHGVPPRPCALARRRRARASAARRRPARARRRRYAGAALLPDAARAGGGVPLPRRGARPRPS